jgi:hypothetical protein
VTVASLARDLAMAEVGVPWRALRYVRGGFRAAQPAGGFAYDDGGNAPLGIAHAFPHHAGLARELNG